jgi:ribonuclease R
MTKKSFKKADPNYQKELSKYGNPIPSRDYILQIIRENNAPMSREEILSLINT